MVLKLVKEITGQDLGGVSKDLFQMGKKPIEVQIIWPILVKFESYSIKNLIMENSFKLKKSAMFKNVMLNHGMFKEERVECRIF